MILLLKKTTKKWMGWLTFAFLLLHAGVALCEHEVLQEPFIGHFAERKVLHKAQKANSEAIEKIPAGTSLWLTPVTSEFAETTYNGTSGYIQYQDALHASEQDIPVTPYQIYAQKPQNAYAAPHLSHPPVMVYPAETPLTVTAKNGAFLCIEASDGSPQYLLAELLLPLAGDKPMYYPAYMDQAAVLLECPLAGAPVLGIVPMSKQVTVLGHNGRYARIKTEAWEGYVLQACLLANTDKTESTMLACVTETSVAYSQPNEHAFTDQHIAAGTIVEIKGKANGYSYIKAESLYVPTQALEKLKVTEVPLTEGFWEAPQALYTYLAKEYIPLGATLPADTPLDIQWAFGGYYCIHYAGTWGLIPKEGMKNLAIQEEKAQLPAIIPKGAELKEQPMAGASILHTMPEDIHFWVTDRVNEYAVVEMDGHPAYIEYAQLRQVGEIKRVFSYEVYVEDTVELLDFPHESGAVAGEVPGNSLLTITRQNEGYALVQQDGQNRFIALSSTKKLEDVLDKEALSQNYYLFVNKRTKEMTVYLADEKKQPTDTIVRQTLVTIGRETNPTPVGTYTLGKRQRWRYFGWQNYGPFSIGFGSRVYMHGPLYYSTSEDTIKKGHLKEWGMARTSGCIRVPYDEMLWIYCHCSSENAVLEIVNNVAQAK